MIANGLEVSFGMIKMLQTDCSDGCSTLKIFKVMGLYTLTASTCITCGLYLNTAVKIYFHLKKKNCI